MPLATRSIESRPPRLVPVTRKRGAKRPVPGFSAVARLRARASTVWAPAEELAAAERLAIARVQLWTLLLADAGRVAIARGADEMPEDAKVRAGLDRVAAVASRARSKRGALAAAAAEIAPLLADADRDLQLGSRLVGWARAQASSRDRTAVLAAWNRLQAERRTFAEANLRLVGAMVRRFLRRGLDADDLAQEGSMGLLRAVDRYDHRLGFRFSTYAVWWVRHAMERAIRNRASLVRIPVPTQDALYRLARVRAEMARREGRSLTERELADAGFSAGTVRRLDRASSMTTVVSLHAEAFEDEGPRTPVIVDDSGDAEEIVGQRELVTLASAVLDRLRPREAEVLRRRFGLEGREEQTLAQIGESLRMSRERVRQIQNDALHRMRTLMVRRDPELPLRGVAARPRLAS